MTYNNSVLTWQHCMTLTLLHNNAINLTYLLAANWLLTFFFFNQPRRADKWEYPAIWEAVLLPCMFVYMKVTSFCVQSGDELPDGPGAASPWRDNMKYCLSCAWKLLSSVHTVFKSGLTKLSRVFSTTNICIIMQRAKNKTTTTKIPNKTKTQEKDQCALKKGDNCGYFFFLTTDAFGLKMRNPVLAVEGWVPTQIQKNRATAGNESSDTLCHCCSLFFFDNKCFWTVTQTKWLTT